MNANYLKGKMYNRCLPHFKLPTPFLFTQFFYMLCMSTMVAQSYNIDDVNGDFLVLNGEPITIYDSGGPNGSYQNNEDYQVTICSGYFLAGCPDPPTINAIFNFFDVEGNPTCTYDAVEIVGGGIYCNDNLPPLYGTTAVSYVEDLTGCITLRFYSDISIVNEGFEIIFEADHVQTVIDQPLVCGSELEGEIQFYNHGCPSCIDVYECQNDLYGPYYGSEVQYSIDADGPVTLTVEGDVDFFVYGYSTIVGPNGCPPISHIACATGSQSSVSFDASDYPYGIWVIVDSEFSDYFYISLDCDSGCNPCNECFYYLPRYQSPNIVDFVNQYCHDFIPIRDSRVALTYQWAVQNATVQYTSGTNAQSENPSIVFPGAGSYTICQTVRSNGIVVFECCRTVVIGSCNIPPVAFYTSQFFSFNNVFKLTANANGNQVRWSFSDPDVEYWQGNEFSVSPEIQIPFGKCVIACLYVTNACGTSSYCTEICFNNSSCGGTTPPVFITNGIEPFLDNKTIEINLPNPPGGSATYSWDFGDGNFSSAQDISHTYDDYGNYMVCVVVTIGCRTLCYCWSVGLNPCEPEYTYNDGELTIEFTGTENNLQYTFSSFTPKAPGESWLVDNEPVSGNSSTLTYSFPSAGNYTVCFPYIGSDGCVHYYCIDVGVGNPFLCNSITWQYASATGYRFSIPGGFSDILWTVDETGQEIGQNPTSNWVLPASPCNWRTISVRYFDGVRYRICCLRVYLCPPDECFGSIDYGYLSSTDQATFKLNTTGSTDINWYFDDAPSQSLGSATSIVIPYPGSCLSRWISVRYKDSSGRWRICCRLIYFCNPVNCNVIKMSFTENSGFRFSVDQAYENMSWILEETGTSLGTGLQSSFVPVGPSCDYRTVSLRYWIPGLGWQLCCLRFYLCDPVACGDNITFTLSGNTLQLEAPDNLQDVTWYKDGTLLGTGNPLSTNISSNVTHKIYIRYFDPCDNSSKWCCRTYVPGGNTVNLTFDFDNKVCGEQNQIVEIPLKVRGFTNIKNFQFSIQVTDTLKGKLISILPQNIAGDFESNLVNGGVGGVFWENPTALSLNDQTIIAVARVRIVSSLVGETKILIAGSPIPVYAEDGNGNELIPVLQDGSFCYENLVSVCGRVTREDLLPIANVNVSLNGCKQYFAVSDANGNYCFTNIPSGATYEIRASKDTNYKNGVNSGDLSAIKRHILGIVKLNTPYKILAADSKKSNTVNTGDVSEIRRLILGSILDFPTCESWEFTSKAYTFPVPVDPFSSSWPSGLVLQNIQNDITGADLIGWKMGDVNGSNNPQGLAGDPWIENRQAQDIYLLASSEHIPFQDTFTVDISTQQFERVSNGQFSIRYDKDKFDLHNTTGYHPALDLNSDNFYIDPSIGSLSFVWDAIDGITLADNSILFSLKFTPKVAQIDISEIYFSQEPVSFYFENEDGEELNVITASGQVTVPTKQIGKDELIIYPNPNGGKFNVLGLHGHVSLLQVVDSRGVVVYEMKEVEGEMLTDIELPESGVYFLRVICDGRLFSNRLVVVR